MLLLIVVFDGIQTVTFAKFNEMYTYLFVFLFTYNLLIYLFVYLFVVCSFVYFLVTWIDIKLRQSLSG